MKKKTVKKVLPKKQKKEEKKSKLEVITHKLVSEEKLETLVRLPFQELIGLGFESFLQNITVLAIGKDDTGNFKLENIVVRLAGVINEDIVFFVAGDLKKYEVSGE